MGSPLPGGTALNRHKSILVRGPTWLQSTSARTRSQLSGIPAVNRYLVLGITCERWLCPVARPGFLHDHRGSEKDVIPSPRIFGWVHHFWNHTKFLQLSWISLEKQNVTWTYWPTEINLHNTVQQQFKHPTSRCDETLSPITIIEPLHVINKMKPLKGAIHHWQIPRQGLLKNYPA